MQDRVLKPCTPKPACRMVVDDGVTNSEVTVLDAFSHCYPRAACLTGFRRAEVRLQGYYTTIGDEFQALA
jgi:hypothetical protein